MKKLRRMAVAVALVFAGSVAGLLLAELTVRAFADPPGSGYGPILDSRRAKRLAPGTSMVERRPEFETAIQINAAGFRDGPFQAPSAGVGRLAMLGDSFTFATGVDQADRASEVLATRLGVEVLNFGVPDTQTWDQAAIVAESVLEMQPTGIVLMFYVGNDVLDNRISAAGDVLEPSRPSGLRRLVQGSYLYAFLMRRTADSPALAGWYNELKTTLLFGETENQLSLFDTSRVDDVALWDGSVAAVEAFVDAARRGAVPVTLVFVPTRLQYDAELWSQVVAAQGLDVAAFDVEQPQRVLAAKLGRIDGLRLVDPLDAFRRAQAAGDSLYYPIDGHLNRKGQRLLGMEIGRALAAS